MIYSINNQKEENIILNKISKNIVLQNINDFIM